MIRRLIQRFACTFFHWGCVEDTPAGLHHMKFHCHKCGREWDEFDP